MSSELQPDLCVVGGGPGGIALALGAAARGLSVVLAEKGTLGGRRLNGAVQRHALLAASRMASALRGAADFGITVGQPEPDFARIAHSAADTLAAIAPNYSQARLEAMNVKVLCGRARFLGPDSCEAAGAAIRASRFVIAAGTADRRLLVPGLDLVRPLDCAGLCALGALPRRLIVVGADPDGLALAQAVRRLGGGVAVLAEGEIFAGEDEELFAPVRAAFVRDGIALYEGARIARVEPAGDGVRVLLAGSGRETPVAGTHILFAAGRRPAVEGLDLAAARVRYDASGIATNASLATSNPLIHAIGSVVRGGQADGSAEHHAALVLRAILGFAAPRLHGKAEIRVVSTSPAVAMAGLSEAQARAAHGAIRILRWPFSETERARLERCQAGHVKLVSSASGTIVGAGIVGPGAEELITMLAIAISKGMTAGDIASIMVPWPALAGAVRSAATTLRETPTDASLRRSFSAGKRIFWREMLDIRETVLGIGKKARRLLRD